MASRCEAVFSYRPDEAGVPDRVVVVGDFNGWTGTGWELVADSTGVFRGRFRVGAGRHLYRLDVDGVEQLDPGNPLTRYGRDGREHSLLLQPDCSLPDIAVRDVLAQAPGAMQVRFDLIAAEDGQPFDADAFDIRVPGVDGGLDVQVEGSTLTVELSGQAEGKYRMLVKGKDLAGRPTRELRVPLWIERTPFDWSDAIIYQIVTDRFLRGAEPVDSKAGITRRMGGDLDGIRHAMETGYFEKFGVNALWISPANRNADGLWQGFDDRMYESYHGYWPTAPQEVDARIGGAAALEALLDAAHRRGIRVILDVVMNHVHLDHTYFQEHREEWFNHPRGDCVCGRECSWTRDIQTCWFTDYLPDLDWTRDVVVDRLLADTVWWLDRFDFDGLRIDAVAMMPRLATRNLNVECNSMLGSGNAPIYLLGENFTGPGAAGRNEIRRALGPYGLSGQFDFPLMWSIRSVIAQDQGSLSDLLDEADASDAAWKGSGAVMGLIVGNHDIPRFLSLAAGSRIDDPRLAPDAPDSEIPYRKMFMAFAFLYSLSGVPIMYYGDEFGMPGAGDPDNRRPMRFGTELSEFEAGLADRVARLGRMRRGSPAMRKGARTVLVSRHDQVAYLTRAASDVVLVAMNRSSSASRVRVQVPEEIPEDVSGGLKDCFGNTWERSGNVLEWVAPPYGTAVLAREEVCNATH